MIQRGALGMNFAFIPPGTFQMGASNGQVNEQPVHQVRISKGFYMQTTEVTQSQWKAVMGRLPSKCDWGELKGSFLGDSKPIICITWNDAQEFIRKLNGQSGDGSKYRLPTEAEWEYAARAGTMGDYAGNLDSLAWYDSNSGGTTHDVGTKSANDWGLYDMHGNVWEWVSDQFEIGYYGKSPRVDPGGPSEGSTRVYRGGSWYHGAQLQRSALRGADSPNLQNATLGFRLVMALD
jgi:formylglycine-generating enzyme required for sulfatase activity